MSGFEILRRFKWGRRVNEDVDISFVCDVICIRYLRYVVGVDVSFWCVIVDV